MKKKLCIIILCASLMIATSANAMGPTVFACNNGIISLGDTASTVKRKCTVESKEISDNSTAQFWTVTGSFSGGAILTIRRGKVVSIEEQ